MLWLPGAFWEVPGVPLRLLGCSLGVHLGSLGCLKGSLEGPLGHSGGLMGIPGLLLVALGRLLSILGRSWGSFREIPGDSGSHFGSFWHKCLMVVRTFLGLVFLLIVELNLYQVFMNCGWFLG